MKKILFGMFLGIFTLAGIAVLPNSASAADAAPKRSAESGFTNDWWRTDQNLDYNAGVAGSDTFQKDSLIKTIQKAINWVLWILSFIALCLCLWGGFQMMTSGGDQKKYESWLNVLKWAAIGLAVIACSWLIVSLVFYVINGSTGSKS